MSATAVFDNGFEGLHDEIICFNDPKAMSLAGKPPVVKTANADVKYFASAPDR